MRSFAVRKKRALDKAFKAAEKEFRQLSPDQLAELAESPQADKRLLALVLMRKQIASGGDPREYFDLARRLVSDPDNNCRWQSLIVIAELIESEPDLAWDIVSKFGDSYDDDMRMAMAKILLEHLLDRDFDRYFSKTKEEIQNKRYRFIDTLESCSFGGREGTNYKKAHNFLKNAKRGLSESQWNG